MQASRHAQPLVVGDDALQVVREAQGGSEVKRIEGFGRRTLASQAAPVLLARLSGLRCLW
jgi:hypothetical protein